MRATLTTKASKALERYSQARGLTPSQAVIHLVEDAEPDEVDEVFDRLLNRPLSKLKDKTINKIAVDAVKRHRSS